MENIDINITGSVRHLGNTNPSAEKSKQLFIINLGGKGMISISLKDHDTNKSVIIITMMMMIY